LLINAIPKLENKDKAEVLLYTGGRYSELRWLFEHPEAFKQDFIQMPSTKPKAHFKERIIRLNNQGKRTVANFLRSKRNLPTHIAFDEDLERWCKLAGLDPVGVSVKAFRKTWESWLANIYPNNWLQIFLSQGHSEKTAMEYYLSLPFNADDRKDMLYYVEGWL
jgi:integrase